MTGRARTPRRRRDTVDDQGEMTRERYDEIVARRMSEKRWESDVQGFFNAAGFDLFYHTLRSIGSDRGFLDDVAISRDRRRLVVIENKKQDGVLSISQVAWLDGWAALRDNGNPGIEVYQPVRPLDRGPLISTLYDSPFDDGARLHPWHAGACERCDDERERAFKRGKA